MFNRGKKPTAEKPKRKHDLSQVQSHRKHRVQTDFFLCIAKND